MTKIKLCGLSRPCDVEFVNEAIPDFCGFIIDYPRSRRSVTPAQVRALARGLRREIVPVGVFVDASVEMIAALADRIQMVQLHGHEDEAYIARLRRLCDLPVIQAFQIERQADVARALASSADHVLLDNGRGTGAAFDWSLLAGIDRPYLLAGGLTPENLPEAVRALRPWGVDLSSGVETGGFKDREKMRAAVAAVRACNKEESI